MKTVNSILYRPTDLPKVIGISRIVTFLKTKEDGSHAGYLIREWGENIWVPEKGDLFLIPIGTQIEELEDKGKDHWDEWFLFRNLCQLAYEGKVIHLIFG